MYFCGFLLKISKQEKNNPQKKRSLLPRPEQFDVCDNTLINPSNKNWIFILQSCGYQPVLSLWTISFACNGFTKNKHHSPDRGWARCYGTWTSLNQFESIHRGTEPFIKRTLLEIHFGALTGVCQHINFLFSLAVVMFTTLLHSV